MPNMQRRNAHRRDARPNTELIVPKTLQKKLDSCDNQSWTQFLIDRSGSFLLHFARWVAIGMLIISIVSLVFNVYFIGPFIRKPPSAALWTREAPSQDHKDQEILDRLRSGEATSQDKELLTLIEFLQAKIKSLNSENFMKLIDSSEDISNMQRSVHRLNSDIILSINSHLAQSFESLLKNLDFLSNQKGFSTWLHALLEYHAQHQIESTAEHLMPAIISKLSAKKLKSVKAHQIEKIIQSAVKLHEADSAGLADYALGGPATAPSPEASQRGSAVTAILGVPIWYLRTSPHVRQRPRRRAGQCWAFKSFPGFLVIQLGSPVEIVSFSMEHAKELGGPGPTLDSTPKEFEVYGLRSRNDGDPVKLGEYVFDLNGAANQIFSAQNSGVFRLVELRIKSNYGNPNFTCLYRFRVHGNVGGAHP